MSDDELFDELRNGKHHLLDELYRRHRPAFLSYAQRQLSCTEEDAVDCFQDAVIAFYKNLVSGRLTELTCSIRTYLFSIGKRLVYRRNQQRRREAPTDHEDASAGPEPADEVDLSLLNRFEDDHRRATLTAALGRLDERCRRILTLTYYHRYSSESIQHDLGFSSPGAVRIKRMRCLDKLKQILGPQ